MVKQEWRPAQDRMHDILEVKVADNHSNQHMKQSNRPEKPLHDCFGLERQWEHAPAECHLMNHAILSAT